MIQVKQIEYHVADACNLSCEYCSHYSNFTGPANLKSVQKCAEEWSEWSSLIQPSRFHIIGGEPLLNPSILQIVQSAFNVWSKSTICLYSNGLLLKNHPGLRTVLRGGIFALGLHYANEKDLVTRSNVEKFFIGTGVQVEVIDGAKGWLQFYKIENGNPVPYSDENQRASWECCVAAQQGCLVLRDGKLWKCPQVAFADRAGVAHWFDGYQACSPDDDIASWLAKEDESCCSRCPAQPQFTEHGSNHMKARLPLVQIT